MSCLDYMLAFMVAALLNTILFGALFWILRPSFFSAGIFFMVGLYTLGFGLPVMLLLGFPMASWLERRDVQSPFAWLGAHFVIGCLGMLLGLAVTEGPARFWQMLEYDPRFTLVSLAPAALTASATSLGYWAIAVR